MEAVSTDPLRALAPKWSLAGDDQLLHLLQSTHQRIISKCQAVNSKLEEMASALDDASINLQNVNNKFMALSNSQFIESRVYDDDADLTAATPPAQVAPQPSPADEMTMLRNSLLVLEHAHETAEILDDSDSDSDAEISVVLKPKDMYSHRPLPYIIGSQPWKNKWHAGLIAEDSDTDSSTSKQDRDMEQYSDSEEEISRPPLEEHTLSESSSSLPGSLGAPTQAPAGAPGAPPPARPADIAAALAKRLAGDAQTIVREETEEYPPAAPAHGRKVYKPEQPATSAIFSDEPPPLAECSDHSSDEDIFAEINRNTPYTQRNKVQSNLADDLFCFEKPAVEQGDIFSDFAPTRVQKPYAKPKSTLFEGESEPELFAEPPHKKEMQNNNVEKDEPSTKKPVGGISLFGSNKDAESIGAAILNRNQRKSSTSGDESGSDDVNSRTDNITKQIQEKPKVLERKSDKTEPKAAISKTIDETDNQYMAKREKDIFEDLFSKSEKTQNKSLHIAKEPTKVTPVKEKGAAGKEKEKTNVKDLFSDNIFDDIDDIFTSNVKIPSKKTNQKSIFDDDDLFSDIDIAKTTKQSGKDNNKSIKDNTTNVKDVKTKIKDTKSIFDSDDELFSETKSDTDKPVIKTIESHATKDNFTRNKNETEINSEVIPKIENIKKPTGTTKERNLFDDSPQIVKPDTKTQMKSKTIFDSDSDDDIFAKLKTPDRKINHVENFVASSKNYNKTADKEDLLKAENNSGNSQLTTENIKAKEKGLVKSPSLFEEDEIDDLFVVANKLKESNEIKDTKVAEVQNVPAIVKESVTENLSKVNENDIPIKVDTEKSNLPQTVKDPEPDTKNKSDSIPNKDMISGKTGIFDDNLLEDDLFLTPKDVLKSDISDKVSEIADIIESSQKVNASETKEATKSESKTITELPFEDARNLTVETEIDTKIKKHKIENVDQSVFDDLIEPAKEKKALTSELKIPVSKTGIYDDIFTEPPAFEKVAEPKKSKNINALFDDDSDDESLFFKKDDVISDEKPDVFSKNANFDIFVDEPPAIDVDFTTPAKNIDVDDDLFNPVQKTDKMVQSTKTLNDEKDIIVPVPEKKEIVSKLTENIDTNYGDELFSSVITEERVPKSMDFDNNVDLISVPEMQENVPDSFKVIEQKTKDDKPKISNDVTEIPAQSNVFERIEDNDLFSPQIDKTSYSTIVEKPNVLSKDIDSDDELFASLPNLPAPSQKNKNDSLKSAQNISKSSAEKNKTDELDDILKSPKNDTETKKIGKLNTKNFNINVNALIPGASPKKIPKERKDEQISEIEEPRMVKIIPDELNPTNNKDVNEVSASNIKPVKLLSDETDYKPKCNSDKNENNAKYQQDPKTAKSITFDEKSESEVLDNNLSKQRPRIQVKRRPSSRRARHEAVRKSAVDFSDDTDNSSSFDEPKPRNVSKEVKTHDNNEKHHESDNFNTSKNKEIYDINIENLSKDQNLNTKPFPKDNTDITKDDKNTPSQVNSEVKSDIFDSMLTNLPPHKDRTAAPSISSDIKETRQHINENKQTTTKIVYILNDEDIFNTDSTNTEKSDNYIRSQTSNILKSTEGIQTLGKTYKDDTEKKNKEEFTPKFTKEEIKSQQITPTKDVKSYKNNKISLFDDSDEELFNKNKKTTKNTTIFDSDSEEDLFSGKKSTEKKKKEVRNREVKERKEVVVKGSLFGDDDDDDDLFGVKKEKDEPKRQFSTPSTSKEASTSATASKSAEPVFDDPLSMLGDD